MKSDWHWRVYLCLALASQTSLAMASMPTATAASEAMAAATQLRCGWYDNPSPGNASLVDRDGDWLIGQQGGHQASGEWPRFGTGQWVRTGAGSAGYGCACLRVEIDSDAQEIRAILSSRALPLANCRKDKALRGQEPVNPLQGAARSPAETEPQAQPASEAGLTHQTMRDSLPTCLAVAQ